MEKQLLASVSALGRWLRRPYDRLFSRRKLIRFRHNRQSLRCLQSKFASANGSAPAELRVTMGIAPLEERYLAGEINLLQDVLFFGPARPSVCWNGSEDIREWLQDEDSRAAVYIAFGTMVVPPRAVLRKLVTTAVERGARMLVATKQDPRSRNDRARNRDALWTSWAPQSAILAEDCIKAFVTHAVLRAPCSVLRASCFMTMIKRPAPLPSMVRNRGHAAFDFTYQAIRATRPGHSEGYLAE